MEETLPLVKSKSSVLYGNLREAKYQEFSGGQKAILFSEWGNRRVTGQSIEFERETIYADWANPKQENTFVVEDGRGVIRFNNQDYPIEKGYAIKIFPKQKPIIRSEGKLVIFSVQMPASAVKAKNAGEDFNRLKVINTNELVSKAYEYESLGTEVFTCAYKPGMGLLKFDFPIDKIPIHKHPYSDRIIRTISGEGYTYAQPERYPMNPDTYSAFPKGHIHTNGPTPGSLYRVWAFQLPWIDSKIDEENIAGDEKFVRYVESVPPKPLWKTTQMLLNAMRNFFSK